MAGVLIARIFRWPLVLAAAHPDDVDRQAASLWEWIEAHGTVVYPIIALMVIGLIAGAMISSARANSVTSEQRGLLKMQIMGVMRRRISGVSAEQVSNDLRIDVLLAAKLLAELESEGMLSSVSDFDKLRYRLHSGV